MNIYEYGIKLTQFHAISSNECHVGRDASYEQTLKNYRIRILNLDITRRKSWYFLRIMTPPTLVNQCRFKITGLWVSSCYKGSINYCVVWGMSIRVSLPFLHSPLFKLNTMLRRSIWCNLHRRYHQLPSKFSE